VQWARTTTLEEEEEDIYLAQTVTYKYTSDKLKTHFKSHVARKP